MVENKGNIKNRKYNMREWKQTTSVISINECGVFKQFKEKDFLGQKKMKQNFWLKTKEYAKWNFSASLKGVNKDISGKDNKNEAGFMLLIPDKVESIIQLRNGDKQGIW